MSWTSAEVRAWLIASGSGSDAYRHGRLTEDARHRGQGLESLRALAAEAHRDARERLERLVGQSLDPLIGNPPPGWGPYPDALHTTVVQGYLGELFAGLIAENYTPHGQPWQVPAFLFRDHLAASQAHERQRQLGGPSRPVPGRTGGDALAFRVDADGSIVAWLWGEAKCTHDHSASLIAAAHEQLSAAVRIPVDLLQLIEVLESSDNPDRERWVASLRELLYASELPPRFDMCVYVCGRHPVRDVNWMSADAPHTKYSGGRPLHAIEVHLTDFDEVLIAAYPQHRINRA